MKIVVRILKQKAIKPTTIMANWMNGRWEIAIGKQNKSYNHSQHSRNIGMQIHKLNSKMNDANTHEHKHKQSIASFRTFVFLSDFGDIQSLCYLFSQQILTSMYSFRMYTYTLDSIGCIGDSVGVCSKTRNLILFINCCGCFNF